MISHEEKLSIQKQVRLLRLSRSSFYDRPRAVSEADLKLMRQIDELHLEYLFAGSRLLRDMLAQRGIRVGRRHVRTLMQRMAIEALYRKPNTSKPAPGHKIYPYLLRGVAITRSNQVWAMDISYIPMARGFAYLAAVIDWFSRRVLSWKLSITMAVLFCLEALDEALARYGGKPEIFRADSSPVWRLRIDSSKKASRSAWMARDAGLTTLLSSVSGAHSNTSMCICMPWNRSPLHEAASAVTSSSSTSNVHTPA
jgi:putative transposase